MSRTMPLKRKTKTTKTFGPKTKLSKSVAQDVAKIARSVVQKQAETKSYYTNWVHLLYDNRISAVNPIYNIGQGTTSEQIVGEKMFIKNIQVFGNLFPLVTAGWDKTCLARLIVCHARDKLITGNQGAIGASSFMRTGGTGTYPIDAIDLHKVKVLSDTKWVIQPFITGGTVNSPYSVTVPISKNEFYDSDASGYLRDGQYFVALIVYDNRGVASNYWGSNMNTAVNFIDM